MIVVYTCIAGSYDTLIQQPKFSNVKYICYSDSISPGIYKNWEVRSADDGDFDKPNLLNRFYKILPFKFFKEYDYSLYIDGNIKLKSHPGHLLNSLQVAKKSIAVFKHPDREYLKEEFDACISQGKLNNEQINEGEFFLDSIKEEGFDANLELVAGYILLRRHDDSKLNNAMNDWFDIVINKVPRDQLSLVYCLWKHNVDIAYLDDWISPEKFFSRLQHGSYIPLVPLMTQDFFKKAFTKLRSYFS